MKTLKKAAVIGAVAYGGYQLGKLSTGYGHWNHHPRGKNITKLFLKKKEFFTIHNNFFRIWIQ